MILRSGGRIAFSRVVSRGAAGGVGLGLFAYHQRTLQCDRGKVEKEPEYGPGSLQEGGSSSSSCPLVGRQTRAAGRAFGTVKTETVMCEEHVRSALPSAELHSDHSPAPGRRDENAEESSAVPQQEGGRSGAMKHALGRKEEGTEETAGSCSSSSFTALRKKNARVLCEETSAPAADDDDLAQKSRGRRTAKVLFYSFPLAVARMAQKLFRMGARCAAIAFHFSPLLALSIPAFVLWRYSRKYQRLWYGCLLSCVEKCGPAFVKFAQWAATRPDLFPDQLCAHLSELHSCVAPHPLSASLAVCETALVGEMSRLLVLDAGPPVGSGCIAQVHRGRWLNSAAATTSTSQEVAVKILHPGVRESIAADLEILRFLATNVEYLLPCTRFMALSEAVSQFSEILYAQTDLTQEAENTRKFRENFADYSYGRVRFPEIVFAHSDLLVESFEEGRPMQELLRGWEVGDGKSAGRASVEVASNSAVRGGAGTGAATPAPASSQRGRAGGDEVAEDVTLFGRKASAGRWLNLFSWQQEQEDRANKFRRGDEDAGSGNSAPLLQGDAAGRVSPENRPAGVQSTLRKKSRYSNAFLDELSSLALNAYLKMLFHDRFVHADLHPGNMFFKILPNGEPELIFLDCGLSVHLSQKDATNFNDCVYALLHGNPEDAAHLIVKRSPGDPGAVYKQEEFARKVGLLIKDFRKPDSKMHVAHVTGKLLLYAGQHNVTLESCFVNVALSLAVMDGLGRQLKDDFNIFRAATPFLAQAAIRYARGYQ